MATNVIASILKQSTRPLSSIQRQFSGRIIVYNKQPGEQLSNQEINVNVPGLSEAVHTRQEPVGPGASRTGEYKVPEYFNYNKLSYFEAEVEMSQYRCPQPSAVKN